MPKYTILDAVDRLEKVVKNYIREIDLKEVDLSNKIIENRILALKGYLNFLDREGIPLIRRASQELDRGRGFNDRSDLP